SGDCSGSGACVVTMDQARSVTATFAPVQHTLDVSVVGGGSVTSNPAGIDCGADCTEDYDHGTVVTLTASPDAGQQFDGWPRHCSGSGTCVVTMDQARSVTATFEALPPTTTTLATGGTGSGAVTTHPARVDCGVD